MSANLLVQGESIVCTNPFIRPLPKLEKDDNTSVLIFHGDEERDQRKMLCSNSSKKMHKSTGMHPLMETRS